MSASTLQELRSILDLDPGSLRSDQLMDRVIWDSLNTLDTPDRERLAQRADASSELAHEVFGQAEAGPETWRLWYAGQLEGLAGLLRALLGRQLALSTAALVRGRKNSQSILEALTKGDFKLSELAEAVDLDKSQLGRELKVLAQHNLVETVKEGRERWARITVTGRTALVEVLGDDSRPGSAIPERVESSSPPTESIKSFREDAQREFGDQMQPWTQNQMSLLPKTEEARAAA